MSNIPGPSLGLNEIIDAFTMKVMESRNSDGKKYNPLRPSSAGKCEMQLGYDFMEYRGFAAYPAEEKSPETHRLLNLGNPIEKHLLSEMYDAFKHYPGEIRIKYKQQTLGMYKLHDGTWIEGDCDFVVAVDGWNVLCDAKSKGDKYSQFYKSSWDEFCEKMTKTGYSTVFGEGAVFITDLEKFLESSTDEFFKDNLYQLNKYACTDFMKERGINLCAIMQYNKNDSRLREIRFVPSQVVYDKVKTKFLKVAEVVDTTKSVEGLNKDYVLGNIKCAFCRHKTRCWPEDDALKAFFNQLPPKQWAKDLNRLPTGAQDALIPLFEEFHQMQSIPSKLAQIEEKIVKVLDQYKVYKIRIDKGQVYRLKRLKEGLVLRRDKE